MCPSHRTVLVVGANRGIGLALCQRLKTLGREVIAACRRTLARARRAGRAGRDRRRRHRRRQRRRAGQAPGRRRARRAGLQRRHPARGRSRTTSTSPTSRAQIEVNALGPLRVVKALRRNIRRGGKLALITSRMGSIADNGSGGYYGYRMSKAALNAAGMSLARDLRGAGVAVAILHPGYVRTDMTGGERHRRARRRRQAAHRSHRRAHARDDRHLLARERPGSPLVSAAGLSAAAG